MSHILARRLGQPRIPGMDSNKENQHSSIRLGEGQNDQEYHIVRYTRENHVKTPWNFDNATGERFDMMPSLTHSPLGHGTFEILQFLGKASDPKNLCPELTHGRVRARYMSQSHLVIKNGANVRERASMPRDNEGDMKAI